MPSSNPANKPHAYQRFIPREEVQAFTAWEFPSMDTAEEAAAQAQADLAEAEERLSEVVRGFRSAVGREPT